MASITDFETKSEHGLVMKRELDVVLPLAIISMIASFPGQEFYEYTTPLGNRTVARVVDNRRVEFIINPDD